MHNDHGIFVRAMDREMKVKLTFYSRKHQRNLVRQCAPLHYGRGMAEGDDLDCYYLWDFEAPKGGNFLAVSPSRIISIEPTGEAFRVEDLVGLIGRQ
jgi:hypothetical protein